MKVASLAINSDGMTEQDANDLWEDIEGFAAYSFNKSHSAAYSLITYQAAWLKANYPVEFYAAALSTADEEKLNLLVGDAKIHGIEVLPPDINISTNEFEIANDTTLYIPFNRIKGISDKTGNAILKARQDGPFTGIEDLAKRVEGRACNVRHRASLDSIGAMSRVEPGQLPALDERRRKEQMALLPGLMAGVIVADRKIPCDNITVARIKEIIEETDAIDPDVFHAKPAMGRYARFMVVSDCPQRSEEHARKMTEGDSFSYTAQALAMADLTRNHAYWTSLVKRKKAGKSLSPHEIKTYSPLLDREVELLRPPLIVTLGSASARHFLPDLKGDMFEHAGRMFWDEKRDAMILVGFNPMMCFFAPEKVDVLAHVFELAKTVILPD